MFVDLASRQVEVSRVDKIEGPIKKCLISELSPNSRSELSERYFVDYATSVVCCVDSPRCSSEENSSCRRHGSCSDPFIVLNIYFPTTRLFIILLILHATPSEADAWPEGESDKI